MTNFLRHEQRPNVGGVVDILGSVVWIVSQLLFTYLGVHALAIYHDTFVVVDSHLSGVNLLVLDTSNINDFRYALDSHRRRSTQMTEGC